MSTTNNNTTATPATPAVPVPTKLEKNIADNVLTRITHFQQAGELVLPKNYSAENALKSAFLILSDMVDRPTGKPVLEVCTQPSIANALLRMVTDGLSVSKRQGSFIVYAGKLTWQREYAGSIVLAKRVAKLKDIKANCIFQGDVFEYEVSTENGRKKVLKHEQKFQNVSFDTAKILGAYAMIELEDGTKDLVIMNIDQIKKAWLQGYAKGNSGAHQNFGDQMCEKTVINRACKLLINTSDDSHLFEDQPEEDAVMALVNEDIAINGNKKVISMDGVEDANIIPEDQKQPEATSAPANQENCPI